MLILPSRLDRLRRSGLLLILFCLVTPAFANQPGLVAVYEKALASNQNLAKHTGTQAFIYQVSESYFDAMLSLSRYASLQSKQAFQARLLEEVNKRVRTGIARRGDLILTEIVIDDVKIQMLNAKLDMQLKLAEFEQYTGVHLGEDAPVWRDLLFDLPPKEQFGEWLAQALKVNTEYQKAKSGLPATQREVDRLYASLARELRASLYGAHAARDKIHILNGLLKTSAQVIEVNEAGFKAGVNTIANVIQANSRFAEYKYQRDQATVELAMHMLLLQKLIGRLDKNTLLNIENMISAVPIGSDSQL